MLTAAANVIFIYHDHIHTTPPLTIIKQTTANITYMNVDRKYVILKSGSILFPLGSGRPSAVKASVIHREDTVLKGKLLMPHFTPSALSSEVKMLYLRERFMKKRGRKKTVLPLTPTYVQ